ncbi:unnamed protein product [Dovyalis caffra]|uniref:Uncharacterized protein n=1 Tax=Dovyalis caffra TaxID=77055 RepID=A0AAV1RJY1_9ROSI|nr:unnamed protein product [Dovyalis caffra]
MLSDEAYGDVIYSRNVESASYEIVWYRQELFYLLPRDTHFHIKEVRIHSRLPLLCQRSIVVEEEDSTHQTSRIYYDNESSPRRQLSVTNTPYLATFTTVHGGAGNV